LRDNFGSVSVSVIVSVKIQGRSSVPNWKIIPVKDLHDVPDLEFQLGSGPEADSPLQSTFGRRFCHVVQRSNGRVSRWKVLL
jgi:hypothetical protein